MVVFEDLEPSVWQRLVKNNHGGVHEDDVDVKFSCTIDGGSVITADLGYQKTLVDGETKYLRGAHILSNHTSKKPLLLFKLFKKYTEAVYKQYDMVYFTTSDEKFGKRLGIPCGSDMYILKTYEEFKET